jgi:two-component system, OmpR family, response regulator
LPPPPSSPDPASAARPESAVAGSILIVEDDPTLVDIFTQTLAQAGYATRAARDGKEMRQILDSTSIDLVLVDIGLPGEDGLVLTRFLREHTQVGVIIVTGRTDPVDRVVGIEIGADDYINKPVFPRELVARVRAVLRRINPPVANGTSHPAEPAATPSGEHTDAGVVRFERFVFDRPRRKLRRNDGTVVRLTTGEFDLLAALISRPGEPLSRSQLMELVHGRDWNPDDRAIDQHVANLRRKLEINPNEPEIIVSIRGVGYAFAASTILSGD